MVCSPKTTEVFDCSPPSARLDGVRIDLRARLKGEHDVASGFFVRDPAEHHVHQIVVLAGLVHPTQLIDVADDGVFELLRQLARTPRMSW